VVVTLNVEDMYVFDSSLHCHLRIICFSFFQKFLSNTEFIVPQRLFHITSQNDAWIGSSLQLPPTNSGLLF